MNRTPIATLFFLGLAATAVQAQSNVQLARPINSQIPTVAVYVNGPRSLSVSDVVSVTDTVPETRRATLRLATGATVVVEFWYPAAPPAFSYRRYLAPVPAVFMTRALQAIQNNPAAFTRPFTLKVWKDSYSSVYTAGPEAELQLFVPTPVHMSGNSQAGGLAEVKIVANSSLTAGIISHPIWGYITLESDSGSRRAFNIISSLNTTGGLTEISAANAEDLSSRIFGSSLWIAFVATPQENTMSGHFYYI